MQTVAPNACGEFSAVAFHFAVSLQTAVSVPIGIIDCYLGGTSILAWLDEDSLSAVTGGKKLLDAYRTRNQNKTDAQYEEEVRVFEVEREAWDRGAEAMKAKDPTLIWDDFIRELGPCPWPPPEGMKAAFRPCGLGRDDGQARRAVYDHGVFILPGRIRLPAAAPVPRVDDGADFVLAGFVPRSIAAVPLCAAPSIPQPQRGREKQLGHPPGGTGTGISEHAQHRPRGND